MKVTKMYCDRCGKEIPPRKGSDGRVWGFESHAVPIFDCNEFVGYDGNPMKKWFALCDRQREYCTDCWKERAKAITRRIADMEPDDELIVRIEEWAMRKRNSEVEEILGPLELAKEDGE